MEEAVEAVGLSRYQFFRRFRAAVGISPQYLFRLLRTVHPGVCQARHQHKHGYASERV